MIASLMPAKPPSIAAIATSSTSTAATIITKP